MFKTHAWQLTGHLQDNRPTQHQDNDDHDAEPTMTMTDDSEVKPTTMQRQPQRTTNDDARKSWYYLCHDQPHLNLIFLSVSTWRVLLAPANPRGFSTVMTAHGCLPCLINVLYHFVQLLHYLPNIIPYFTVAIHCHVDTCVYSMLSLINFIVAGITNPRTILSTQKMVMPP